MKEIPLTKGQVALVDDLDYEDISRFKWCASWDRHTKGFYAKRAFILSGKHITEKMHRRILGLAYGDPRRVDHINHNTLDNQRSNIRIASRRENSENQRNQSIYGPGIKFHKECKTRPFEAYSRSQGRTHYIGMFATVEEATAARTNWLKTRNL